MTLTRMLGLGLLLLLTAASATISAQQTIVVTKCQNCTAKAGNSLKACMAAGSGAACQTAYQKKMTHCNKKYCNPKTTKVKVPNS